MFCFREANTFLCAPRLFRAAHENVISWCYSESQGVSLLFCFAGPNVSVLLVSGGLLVCLSYLAELGVAVSHCLPHWCLCVRWKAAAPERRSLLHRMCFVPIGCGLKVEFNALLFSFSFFKLIYDRKVKIYTHNEPACVGKYLLFT